MTTTFLRTQCITLAALLWITTGCKSNVEIDLPDPHQITFATTDSMLWQSASTRAADNPDLTMTVYGYTTSDDWETDGGTASPNLFSGTTITNSGGTWSYTPLKTWDAVKQHHFFAFSPEGVTGVGASTGTPTVTDFTVPTTVATQTDLMWAWKHWDGSAETPLVNIRATDKADYTPINFHFYHALTKIAFMAKVADAGGTHTITSITLKGMQSKGSAGFTHYPGNANDINAPEWILAADVADYPLTNATPATTGLLNLTLSTTAELLNTTNGYLYLLPQAIDGVSGKEIEVVVSDGTNSRTLTAPLTTPSSAGFEAGQAITYTLTISNGLEVIPTIVPWNDVTVDGDITNATLNLSATTATLYDGAVTRVYFYTPDAPVGTVASNFTVTGVPANIIMSKSYDDSTKEGYIDLYQHSLATLTAGTELTLTYATLERKIALTTTNTTQAIAAIQTPYVGTFHRAAQTGERIVTWRLPNTTDTWTATVEGPDVDDVLIDRYPSPAFVDNTLYTATPADPEPNKVSATYGTVSGQGIVYFRVGWKDPIAPNAHRYARIKVTTRAGGTGAPVDQYLYLRQGEEADYVYRPGDAYPDPYGARTTARTNAAKFDVYNVDTKTTRVAYPTQPGRLHAYAQERSSGIWDTYTELATGGANLRRNGTQINARGVCPTGYTVPNASFHTESSPVYTVNINAQVFHSLYPCAPEIASGEGKTFNHSDGSYWHTSYLKATEIAASNFDGFYADGYFDRYTLEQPIAGSAAGQADNFFQSTWRTPYATHGNNTGISGVLIANPANGASLFLPGGGTNTGLRTRGGVRYWTEGPAQRPYNITVAEINNAFGAYDDSRYCAYDFLSISNLNAVTSEGCWYEKPIRCVEIPTYTVTFDSNGGSGAMPPQRIQGTDNLIANAFTPPSAIHTFAGWSTASGVSNTVQYANTQSFTHTADITLYAVWYGGGSADILYFDAADNNRLKVGKWGSEVTQANMAFFQFGSVIGFTNNDDAWAGGKVLFNPTGGDYSTYTNIPRYNNEGGAGAVNVEGYITNTFHTGANVKLGKGDPCKLIGLTGGDIQGLDATIVGAYDSGWRLPTANENVDFVAAPASWYDNTASPELVNTSATYWDAAPSSGGYGGWFPIPGNRNAMTGRTTRQTDVSGFLPSAGNRNEAGVSTNVFTNIHALWWSNTLYSNVAGYALYYYPDKLYPRFTQNYGVGASVRCVKP